MDNWSPSRCPLCLFLCSQMCQGLIGECISIGITKGTGLYQAERGSNDITSTV